MRLLPRRVPYVSQLELAECGAACLAMILAYHGAFIPLPELRLRCNVSRDGASARDLMLAAAHYGLAGKALKVPLDALCRVPLPAVAHWGFNHFVVLERVLEKAVVVLDPARGRRRLPIEEFGASFTGIALTFAPSEAFRKRRAPKALPIVGPETRRICRDAAVVVLAGSLLLEMVSLVFPASDQFIIDQVVSPRRTAWLYGMGLVLCAASLISAALNLLRKRSLLMLGYGIDLDLTTRFVQHLQRLPLGFFQHRTAGDLLERAEANQSLRELVTQVVTGGLDALLVVGFSLMMLAYDPKLAGLVIALNCTRLALVFVLTARTKELSATELLLAGQERAVVVEAFSRPETIRAFGREGSAGADYVNHMARRLSATLALRRYGIGVEHAASLFDAIASAVVLWVGGNAVIRHELPLGVLVAFFALRLFLQKPLESVLNAIGSLRRAQGTSARLRDVLCAEPEPRGAAPPAVSAGYLELRDVSFRYGASAPILDRVSLTIRPGERIAVVGRIGSGKSTLARLLSGLERPSSGVITLDGQPLPDIRPELLRSEIAVALQDPFVLDGSVFENIALGYEYATLEAVKHAAELACIANVIEALPEGYATRVGLGGARFSGGQLKRLALARALLRRPRILILDEVTASLDSVTERRVERHLATLGCTQISITHRLFSVERADRVVVLENGRIAEQGTYAELAAGTGLFRSLLHASV